ncbi:tetratricopeptide repeat protein [Micromonospora sp. NPDC049836]|uniref:tetratricopeptide repeat protein n=1 Tax=Micromonospora sp. NPDC049836 TaxID=3364274 RepID=UPI0037AF3AED
MRVLISYAHGDPAHEEDVRRLWTLLRAEGVDARLDLAAASQRQFWPQWMSEQIRLARFVIVVGTPTYRERAEGRTTGPVGRGVRWEARQLQELLYADVEEGTRKIVPVLLPGGEETDLPDWLHPVGGTTYRIATLSPSGVEELLRLLTNQPLDRDPPLGTVRPLPPRPRTASRAESTDHGTAVPSPLRSQLLVEASLADDVLSCTVSLAGSPVCTRQSRISSEVWQVWQGLQAGPQVAAQRMYAVGQSLAQAVFDQDGHRLVADLVSRLRPGDWVEVVLSAADGALMLPIELLRLAGPDAEDLGPLGLIAGVSVRRQVAPAPKPPRHRLGRPFKVLAAVAAPDEDGSTSAPLDVEAEMQAVLDAVSDPTAEHGGEVQILEVASLRQISEALAKDDYHVLHLSAHGSPQSVELEDEDGRPAQVGTRQLIEALRDVGKAVPLIVLSSCSGAAGSADAMAAGLVRAGADRVMAMQAPISDAYATALLAQLYQELATRPTQPVAAALARARRRAERQFRDDPPRLPEFAVPTILSAADDPALVDLDLPATPLRGTRIMPTGTSVRELSVGQLIGRRRQLREATAALRRAAEARETNGTIAGVQIIGAGGIGKTAIAGRVTARLRGDGALVAVHEGRWNPTALLASVAQAVQDVPALAGAAQLLRSDAIEDTVKADLVRQLLGHVPLLLVFDDFEQNLTPGGTAFIDPAFDDLFTDWCDGAEVGAILVTCRYPLPDDDRYLVRIPVPPLSPAELRRLLLRLPALRSLPPDEVRLLLRVIGGHPRLIEYIDALVRGKPAQMRSVQRKLRELARQEGVDLRRPRPLDQAVNAALILGSADILLDELLGLLTDDQRAVLLQLSVARAPIDMDDLAFVMSPPGAEPASRAELTHTVERLTDLALLTPGPEILIHPFTAELLVQQFGRVQHDLQERALAMRTRRFEQGKADYADLLEVPRHLAALGRYEEVAAIAEMANRMMPGRLAVGAYLAEVRPLIPESEPSWCRVVKLEFEAVRDSGNLTTARDLLERMRRVVQRGVDEQPSSPEWQEAFSLLLVDLGDTATAAGNLTEASAHYEKALTYAEEWNQGRDNSRWWRHRPGLIHGRLGNVALAAGDLPAARAHYQAALTIAELLVAADPDDIGWQRGLSVNRNKLGDVAVAAGDLELARGHYQAALEIRQRLAAADPSNTEWRRDLSISREKLGDVAMVAGDLGLARGHYQAALEIRQRLAAADPSNTGWRRDLSVGLNKLGDMARAADDLGAARGHYEAGLEIAERLAAADPSNAEWQRDLSISRDKLGDMARAAGDLGAARGHYEAGLEIAERLAAADPSNTEWQRDLSISRNKLGDVAVAVGDLGAAHAHYQAALEIRQRLTAADPSNTGWQRDLSVSRNKLGDVARAAGDLGAARGHYRAALEIAERLAAADPTHTGWQRDLSVSRTKLGDAAVAAGDLGAARAHHQAGLEIAERLAAADPSNREWQRDLSISRNKLGDVAVAAGNLELARAHYRAALEIRQRLAAADPRNTEWQRDLSVSRDKLGDMARAAGDLAAARGHYEAGLEIAERLAAADPSNREWQRDLSVSRNRLGDVAGMAGELEAARGHYQVALEIAERLAAADPSNTRWQRDLSISRNKLGDVAVAAGNLELARAHYQAALEIRERLAAADPSNTEWQRDLSVSRDKLGDVARAAGDPAAARMHHQAGLEIAERLAAADPSNTEWQRDLSISRNKLGDAAEAAGEPEAARGHYQAALEIAERLAATDPSNTDWQRDLSVSRNRLGDVAGMAGDLEVARGHYRVALEIAERLAATDPSNTEWQRDLSISRNKLGDVAQAAGEPEAARGHYQAALEIAERLAATDPSNTEWQRDLSICQERLTSLPRPDHPSPE